MRLGSRLGLGVGVGLGVARLHREDEVVVVEGAADVGELHRRLDLVRGERVGVRVKARVRVWARVSGRLDLVRG